MPYLGGLFMKKYSKSITKTLAVIMSALICVVAFAGCGGKSITADQYVSTMYKLIVNGDTKAAKNIGITDKEIKTFESEREKAVKEGTESINKSFKEQCNAEVEEALITTYFDEYFKALAKLSCTAEIASQDGNTVNVKLTSTYLDMVSLTDAAMETAKNNVKAADYSADMDYKKAVLTEYIKALTENMKNFTPGSEKQSTTVTIKKVNKNWTYADANTFSQALTTLAVKNQ